MNETSKSGKLTPITVKLEDKHLARLEVLARIHRTKVEALRAAIDREFAAQRTKVEAMVDALVVSVEDFHKCQPLDFEK